jgi:hypothetical protein
MNKAVVLIIMFSVTVMAGGPNLNSNFQPEKSLSAPSGSNNFFYGGNINFSFFHNYFYIALLPMIGYKITPELAAGLRLGYAYISDGRISPTLNTNNFGAGAFARYSVIPQSQSRVYLLQLRKGNTFYI